MFIWAACLEGLAEAVGLFLKSSGINIPNLILLLLCVKQPLEATLLVPTGLLEAGALRSFFCGIFFAAQGHKWALYHPQGQCCGWKMGRGRACAHCLLWQGGIYSTSAWIQHLECGQIMHIPPLLSHNTPHRITAEHWLTCAKHRVFPSFLGGWHWHTTTVLPTVTIYSIFTLLEAIQSINLHMSCCHISFHKLHANNNEQFKGRVLE